MQNSAQQMYALSLDECVDLIAAVGTKRTVLMQGDMGNGKSSTLKTLHEKLPTQQAFDGHQFGWVSSLDCLEQFLSSN